MAFHTIQPTPGLDPNRRRRANRAGPYAVAMTSTYEKLLVNAGFREVEARDDTAEYRATQARWVNATRHHETAMRAVMGDAMFEDRLTARTRTLDAVDAGLLSRFRYAASR